MATNKGHSDVAKGEPPASMLPTEILLRIFKKAYMDQLNDGRESDVGPTTTIHLALAKTCHRFEDIINSTSFFWSHIGNLMGDDVLQSHMRRWGDSPITITLWFCNIDPHFSKRFCRSALEASNRWKTVNLGIPDTCDLELVQASFEAFRILNKAHKFPALESMHFYLDQDSYCNDRFSFPAMGLAQQLARICRRWSTPKLHEVTAIGTIPYFNTVPPLRSLDITLRALHAAELSLSFALKPLVELLQKASTLEHLCIKFDGIDLDQEEWEAESGPFSGAKVTLPNLKTLDYCYTTPQWTEHTEDTVLSYQLRDIFDSLTLPALRHASFSADGMISERSSELFNAIIRPLESCAELDMNLDFWYDDASDGSALNMILTRLQNLQHLRISGGGFMPHTETENSPPPALRVPASLKTLHIDNCDQLDHTMLEPIMKILAEEPHRGTFEKLRVCGKSMLKKDEVEGGISPQKLVWEVKEN